MALRFQLINAFLGDFTIEKHDPIDIDKITKTIKRSENSDGVVFEIMLDVDFIKESREYLLKAYNFYGGIDAVVDVLVYNYDVNKRRWKLYYTGQINMSKLDRDEISISTNIEQSGVERRVLNLMDTDVDLETTVSENGSALPAQSVEVVPFHSKEIIYQFNAVQPQQQFVGGFAATSTAYSIIPINGVEPDGSNGALDEIKERFDYEVNPTLIDPTTISQYNFKFENAGIVKIQGTIRGQLQTHKIGLENPTFTHAILLTYGKPGAYTTEVINSASTGYFAGVAYLVWSFDYIKNLTVEAGTEIYIYSRFSFTSSVSGVIINDYSNYVDPSPSPILQSSFNVTIASTFATTNVTAILIYEAFQRCLQYYTNQIDCFKSDLLGRTDIGYAVDGAYSLIVVNNGSRLRNRNDKQIFFTLRELIEFVNAVACVGWGFEIINGRKKFVLEKREYFYDSTKKIGSLGKVYNIKTSIDYKRYYNSIEYGYNTKLEALQTNALDEQNTIRRASIPIINTKNVLKVSTKVITSGYLIERERRLSVSTEDGKFDDNNFATVVLRDGLGYKTKKNEGYSAVTGVNSPQTGYNYDISPARSLKNWLRVISTCTIRSFNKTVKFSFGEVNYKMSTKKTTESQPVYENGNEDLTNIVPLFDPEIYKFSAPVTESLIEDIVASPYGYLEFEDLDGNLLQGFLSPEGVEHNSVDKVAEFQLLKVYRK